MVIYSYSRLTTFEKCKLKYKFRYIDKIIPEIKETIESHLGRTVHETLEWLYKQVLNGKIPSIDQTITTYSKIWQDNYTNDIPIIKQDLTLEDYFNKGLQFLLNYYTTHQPFDDNTIELEKRILLNLGEKDEHQLQGFIDRLSLNKQTGEYEIHDYKTSNNLPSQKTIDQDKQLALYSIALKQIFGQDKKICQTWHYLNFNKKICTRKTDQQLEEIKKEIIELIKKIETTKEFPANKSSLCDWCEYKLTCPEWKIQDWEKSLKPDKTFLPLREKPAETNPSPEKETANEKTSEQEVEPNAQKIQSLTNSNQSSPTGEQSSKFNKEKYPTLKKYLRD